MKDERGGGSVRSQCGGGDPSDQQKGVSQHLETTLAQRA